MVLLLLVTGCASGQVGPVTRVADEFYAAVRAGDGAGACALLTPAAAESVASGDGDCASALLELRLAGAGPHGGVAVWGDEAQVRLAGDTVFLHRSGRGWRIRAAGCRPMGARPYDCEVAS